MSDEAGIKGDKTRRAILLVWLSNKLHIRISTAQLGKMCGYTGSGLYSAKDSGWFLDQGDRFILTDKAEEVLHKDILPQYSQKKMLLIYTFFFMFILLVQSILNNYFNILVIFSEVTLIIALFIIISIYLLFYKLIWFFEKRGAPLL